MVAAALAMGRDPGGLRLDQQSIRDQLCAEATPAAVLACLQATTAAPSVGWQKSKSPSGGTFVSVM
jgi:hypothetical protein